MKLIGGTDKGLLVYLLVEGRWKLQDIHFIGLPIGAFHQTPNGQWWVAINHKHWGPKLYTSTNAGDSFKEIPSPRFESDFSLKSIWTIASNNDDLFIGTEPAAIFVSKDQGSSFKELKGLSNHPSRSTWQGGGKGSKDPFLHSILFDSRAEGEIMVGISCAGVFRSLDKGDTWFPSNKGLEAFYMPNSELEVGHDPHSITRHSNQPDVIWQQNHCGIFRTTDNGNTWHNVSDPEGRAVYGFDLVIDDEDIDKAWVIPAQSDDLRIPYQNKLAVYRTNDAGKSWIALRNGLPQEAAFDMVLRDAFDKSGVTMAFGTNNGNLYVSDNLGEDWSVLSQSLSTVRLIKLL